MVTKLKNKIVKYFSSIWLIEIFVIIITMFYFSMDIYNFRENNEESKVLTSIERVVMPNEYYKRQFKKSINEIDKNLYKDDIFLYLLDKGKSNDPEVSSYTILTDYINDNIKYIFRNKVTGNIITNDPNSDLEKVYFKDFRNGEKYIPGTSEIERYINSKKKIISVQYDNKKEVNPLLKLESELISNSSIKNTVLQYDEYYYTPIETYYNKFETRMQYIVFSIIVVVMVLIIKIIIVMIRNKCKPKIRGNFIYTFIYVLRYGFRFNQTRRTLLISILGLSIFFIGYLYLLAVGGYDNNVIVKFFSRYPFKGSFTLMLLPMIGIIYSIKKSIEISLVNEKLKEINKGNLDYEIVERGSNEIRELIKNIVMIKEGYKIAVNETLKNEKMKTELISNVSHDLRTPLTSIINYVNILGDSSLSKEEREEYLAILEQKSKKLKVLIDDLFEMSKINSGKIELNKSKLEIMSLIHQSIGEYSYLYEHKNVEFEVNSTNDEIYMYLDGNMMSRVLENIVINALKYSLENTRIYIDVKEKNKYVEISVKNIANYKMKFNNDEMFERFVRGDKSRNSNIEGSGLGLAITKSIIELHHGQVKIIREGDMFKIYILLPII